MQAWNLPSHTPGLHTGVRSNTTQEGALSVSQVPSFYLLDRTLHGSSQHEPLSAKVYIQLCTR